MKFRIYWQMIGLSDGFLGSVNFLSKEEREKKDLGSMAGRCDYNMVLLLLFRAKGTR